jgi:hypothetical protein
MTKARKYLKEHYASGLKVGDWVKVLRAAKDHARGWNNSWPSVMNKSVGKVLRIIEDNGVFGFTLRDGLVMIGLAYPWFILKRVRKPRGKK